MQVNKSIMKLACCSGGTCSWKCGKHTYTHASFTLEGVNGVHTPGTLVSSRHNDATLLEIFEVVEARTRAQRLSVGVSGVEEQVAPFVRQDTLACQESHKMFAY